MRVLVVDDQATMRRIIVKCVQKVGLHECREAMDALDALRVLSVTEIDFVITDWNMPGMSGLELIRTLRAQDATRAIPVLMVTRNDTEDQVKAALKAGVSAYVVKPFTAETMMRHLRAILHPGSDTDTR